MEDGLAIKANALEILEKQLAAKAKKNQYGFVAVGSATDAYIHHEEKHRMTEGILQLLLKYRFPVFISTKCTLIARDIELLKKINQQAILPEDLKHRLRGGVTLSVSVSTGRWQRQLSRLDVGGEHFSFKSGRQRHSDARLLRSRTQALTSRGCRCPEHG